MKKNKNLPNYLKKIFFIPSIFLIFFSLIAMIPDESETNPLTWSELILADIILLLLWYVISYIISLIINKFKGNENANSNGDNYEKSNIIIKYFKRTKLSFTMMCITFVISFFFLYFGIVEDIKWMCITMLIGSFPFIIYLIITLCVNKFYEKKYVKNIYNIFTPIFTICVLIYYCVAIFVCLLIQVAHPVTNINKYKYVISDSLLTIFPKQIPQNVNNKFFYYQPGVLQGGTTIILYYVDNSLNQDSIYDKYVDNSKWIGYLSDYIDSENLLADVFYNAPIEKENEKDFKIFLIDGSCDNSGYCNHGNYLIVAINEQTREILYKSKTW